MKRIILLLALLSISCTSQSADSEGKFTAYGMASISCGEYLEDYARSEITSEEGDSSFVPFILTDYVGYVDGAMSTYNEVTTGKSDYFGNPSPKDNMAWIASYCRENTKDAFHTAVRLYMAQLIKQHNN